MEKSMFFNSTVNVKREYNADDFATMFRKNYRNGIYREDNQLTLRCTNTGLDMNTNIGVGSAMIEGHMYSNDGNLTLTHDTADSTNDRIDRVILRLDLNDNVKAINAHIIKGVPAAIPESPSLTRNGLIYEISLAQILVKANSSTISEANIKDERLDDRVCGVLSQSIQDFNMEVTKTDTDDKAIEVSYTLNGALVERTELSNKDVNGNYTTLKLHKFIEDGVTIGHTKEYKLTYNPNNQLIKRELI